MFDECVFQLLFQGIVCGENIISGNGPQGVKVSHSLFDKIHNTAIRTFTVKEFVSAFNTFKDVGNQLLGSGSPSAPVINFDGDNNYSLGDTFDRPSADDATQPRIENNKKKVYGLIASEHVAYGTHRTGPGIELTLGDNVQPSESTGITFDQTVIKSVIVDFTVRRGQAVMTGIFRVAGSNTAGYTLDQDYSENVASGVAFFMDSGTGTIFYTTTSTGSGATMNYRINEFV